MKSLFVFLSILLLVESTWANIVTDLSGYYESDSFTTATTAEYSKTYYSLDVLFNVDKDTNIFSGFHAHQISLSEKPSAAVAATTLSSTDLGAVLLYYFNKKRNFFISAGYNISVNGKYSTGSANSDLTGSSIDASLGYVIDFSDNISLGLKWSYINVSYTKSIVSNVTSDVSYSRVLVFPALTFVWHN